ncbi:hypothetical protein A2645_01055 [Candidatus Nomurabacteria bacterium RIFCSPHIGHO2_01_FULL_39_9]|uniref:TGS domain-containing protein n=1 Tax=Candidatus Nomurabacteria bacterium RIFCSPHIGHO2_01_FULL_39_9 TaxID=1801735 RepID=A0A1F6UVS1_9BACT|nr:MAG: hypothetical protein A2645_01055 [Candidatus Nomurabacteria bacterium RIFCSPHIGHO2_01_FULL_39_9]
MDKLKDLLTLLPETKEKDKNLIEKAFHFALRAHDGQMRKSGEPYFNHVFETAKTLSELKMDTETIAAGLLHDVLEDTQVKEEELKKEFGEDIVQLVEGASKLSKLKYRGRERYVESLRKFFLAISRDIRVLIIKLADRLHNVKTLEYLPAEKAKRIALETIEVHAKLANRLGMGRLKGELEDFAFPFAYPEEYKKIEDIVKERKYINNKYLEKIKNSLLKELAEEKIKITNLSYRLKRHFSLWLKIKNRGNIEKVYDFVALRIIVPTIEDCYRTLGVIHGVWRPVPSQIKDYIALPKPNGYRSLHTTVFTGDGGMVEIQIRTEEMDVEAEIGIAAHFSYKEKLQESGNQFKKQYEWLKEIKKIQSAIKEPGKFLEHVTFDIFKNRIFVFTPQGDVIDLPEEATPVDFAYHIHSEVGNKLSGAKVNDRLRALDEKLQNGDVVEIITKKNGQPSRKWLDFAKTNLAKRHIRNALGIK